MYYWTLSEDASKTTGRWLASISEAMEAWRELATQVAGNTPAVTNFDPAAGLASFSADTQAGIDPARYAETLALFVRAHNASMTAALEGWRTIASMRGANLAPNPFGLTGVFTSDAPMTATPAEAADKPQPTAKKPAAPKAKATVATAKTSGKTSGETAAKAEPKAETKTKRKSKKTDAGPKTSDAAAVASAAPVTAKTETVSKSGKVKAKAEKAAAATTAAKSAKAPEAKADKPAKKASKTPKAEAATKLDKTRTQSKAPKPSKAEKPAKTEAKTKTKATTPTKTPATKLAAVTTNASNSTSGAGKADDFTRINGIGPKMMQTLRDLGYRRFADLAGMSPADVDALESKIKSRGRIIRDAWVRQAQTLMLG